MFFCRIAENSPEEKEKKDKVDENEIMAEKQRNTLPIEERISMFKNMLLEKEVFN